LAGKMTHDLRRYADEAGAATRSKSEFLANMSHEIRTPMTAILGYADLLREDKNAQSSQSKRLEYISTIKRNGNHLLSIINDILDISKIEAGKLSVECIEMSPETLIHEVVSLMSIKANAKGLRLDVVFTTPAPDTIYGDPVRLRQVLVNLVGNAIKFTPAGGVTLEVSFDEQKQTLACAVVDTGIGMTPEQLGRLFGAFEQADSSITRQYGGSGLGLMISRRLAEILGGTLTATSVLGRGSVFTLAVPTGDVSGVAMLPAGPSQVLYDAKEGGAQSPGDSQPLSGMRVLLAEDGEDNQRLISFHLKKAGAEVTIVENGKLAVQALTENGDVDGPLRTDQPFDLLLTDMQMPEMDGYTAVRLLRSKGCTLRIVALTAHAMSSDEQRCLDAGCDGYASKPIDRATLVAICAEGWGPRSAREAAA